MKVARWDTAVEISKVWVTDQDAARLRQALGKRKLVLASASPRRAKVLTQCGIEFIISPVEVGERISDGSSPSGHVVRWSKAKALTATEKWKTGVVLGADTVVFCGERILGKPINRRDAQRLLAMLNGRTHTVYTGMTLIAMPQRVAAYGWCTTRVKFHRMTRHEIDAYIATGEPLDKAGAYGIQEGGRRLVAGIDGPLDNVVGLPVGRLTQLIERVKARLRS